MIFLKLLRQFVLFTNPTTLNDFMIFSDKDDVHLFEQIFQEFFNIQFLNFDTIFISFNNF